MRKIELGCASAAISLALSACGGSGAHVESVPPTPVSSSNVVIPKPSTTPTTENFETDEYAESLQARESNVLPAWQAGASGEGIKIGIVDSGIDPNHPDFAGRIDPSSRDWGGSHTLYDQWGHGTAVASLAAAAHNGRTVEGIAYDATLIIENVASVGCTSQCSYDFQNVAAAIKDATAAGAKVINLSIGGGSSDAVNNAVHDAAKQGVIFVISAGNETASDPTAFARGIINAAPGQVIVVGALGVPGPNVSEHYGTDIDWNQLLDLSNRAGSSRDSYIAAPGLYVRIDAPGLPDGIDAVSGTSFAAPAVTGTVALLLQAFPNLTPQQVVQILLTTADDLGEAGVDTTFGHGRLDIGRAFQPIGATAMAGTATKVSLTNNGSAPAAVGDAFGRGSLRAVVLDAYRRAFTVNLAATFQGPPSSRPLASALSANMRGTSFAVGPFGFGLSFAPQHRNITADVTSAGVGPHAFGSKTVAASLVGDVGRGFSTGISTSDTSHALLDRLIGTPSAGRSINSDVLSSPGFAARSGTSFGMRKTMGGLAVSTVQETGYVKQMSSAQPNANYRLSTLSIDKRMGSTFVTLAASGLVEDRTVLGGSFGPIFGTAGSRTTFIDGQISHRFGSGWSVSAKARRGWTKFAAGSFTTGGYSLNVIKSGVWGPSDTISLLFSQPLRVEAGGISMSLPGTYDYTTSTASRDWTSMSLRPTGRELVSEVDYARRLGFGSVALSFYGRREPGHFASAKPDLGGALQFHVPL